MANQQYQISNLPTLLEKVCSLSSVIRLLFFINHFYLVIFLYRCLKDDVVRQGFPLHGHQ